MPRDAAATRDALITAGRRLLARPGGLATPVKEIVDAAGQRNVSALHYHFGGRRGLVDAILDVHGGTIEDRRAAMLQPFGPDLGLATLPQLVDAFIAPQAELLDTAEGRQFLSIISQLVDLFDRWDLAPQRTGEHAMRVFRALQERMPPSLSADLRHERITRFLELVTSALGARARNVDAKRSMPLSTGDFLANLAAMSIGALASPAASTRPDSF
jgi:TetR/AcrR family transcriptional regulator, regulator of cefoperazone and chloramphenicol sensitivity